MHNEKSPDPIQLQRLIDGELSAAETKAMLETAEQHPEHWRTIACEFAEDQLFRKQFSEFADNFDPSTVSKIPAAPVQQKPSPVQSTPTIRHLAVVASFAVAGLIGYLIGSDGPISTIPSQTTGAPEIASSDPVKSRVTPVELRPEYRMELLTPDGESINGEVDLYRSDDLHRLVSLDKSRSGEPLTLNDVLPPSGLTSQARQRLTQSGYEVNESTNYMSGRLQDGRKFVVPVRSIRFDQGH